MAIPNPNPNIADGIKSDNKTYSSNKIESLIQTATELPIPEAGDAGKVLTVNEDADGYELDDIPSELPTPAAGDAGKVLTVNVAEDGYELDSLPSVETISAEDFFTDTTDIDSFVGYRYGKIMVIHRCKFKNVSYASTGYTTLATVKDAFKPAGDSFRCILDDGASNTPIRCFFEGNGTIRTLDVTSASNVGFLYGTVYMTV